LPHIAWGLPYTVCSCSKVAGRIESTGRRGIRGKQIMNDLKETIVPEPERGNTSSSSVENTLWKSFGPVVRRTTEISKNGHNVVEFQPSND